MSDSVRPHGLQPTRLLRPWDFQGKNTGVGCHCLPHKEQNIGISRFQCCILKQHCFMIPDIRFQDYIIALFLFFEGSPYFSSSHSVLLPQAQCTNVLTRILLYFLVSIYPGPGLFLNRITKLYFFLSYLFTFLSISSVQSLSHVRLFATP